MMLNGNGVTELQRIVSHVRSIKRHVPPEFTADWRMLDEAADLLLIQARNEERLRRLLAACDVPVYTVASICCCGATEGHRHARACPVWQDAALEQTEP